MNDRQRLLGEIEFAGNALLNRSCPLEKIGKGFLTVHDYLLENPTVDPYALTIEERTGLIPYTKVWKAIDMMKCDEKLTGCEIATGLIKAHEPIYTRRGHIDPANLPKGSRHIILE